MGTKIGIKRFQILCGCATSMKASLPLRLVEQKQDSDVRLGQTLAQCIQVSRYTASFCIGQCRGPIAIHKDPFPAISQAARLLSFTRYIGCIEQRFGELVMGKGFKYGWATAA